MLRTIAVILLIMLVGCYNSADKPLISGELPTATTTMGRLRSDVVGSGNIYITDNVIVHGRVVSSDIEDNFYRSFIVEGIDGAVEIMAGVSPLDAIYPEGLNVALNLQGCYAGYSNGVLQIGIKAHIYDNYDVGYLASQELLDKVVIRSKDVAVIEPHKRHIDELKRDECGTLTEIDGLHLISATSIDTLVGETLSDARWQGYTLFKDDRGESIAVYTRDYAHYANNIVPNNTVAITGILQWAKYNGGKECFHIKMRYERDCTTR